MVCVQWGLTTLGCNNKSPYPMCQCTAGGPGLAGRGSALGGVDVRAARCTADGLLAGQPAADGM